MFVMILLAVQAFAFTATGTVTGNGVGALVNANVTAYNATGNNQINSTLTDASGQYSLEVGNNHLIFINATSPGFDEQGWSKFVLGDFTQDFALGPISSVTLNGTVSNSTGPIQNANVLIQSGTYAPVNAHTDVNGYYEVAVVDSLTYSVTVSATGHNNDNANVVINGNTTRDFTLTPFVMKGNVSGKVTDYVTGANLSGAVVRAIQDGVTVMTTVSDANGDYSLTDLQPGTYNITGSLVGYNDDVQSTEVQAGSSSATDLQLVAQGAVCTETVVDSGYGSCQSDGFKYKTITRYNESGVCGAINVTTERTSCEGGSSGSSGARHRSPGGVNPYITSFTNYVTQIWSPLLAGKDYTMKIANDEIAIYEVTFSVKEDFTDAVFSVGKLISEPKDAYDGVVYQYGDIKHDDVPNSAVKEAKIKFRVKNKWFKDNDLDKDTVALYRYHDKKWQKLDTENIGTDKKYSYFESYSPGLSIYAVSAERVRKEEPTVEPKQVRVGLDEAEVQKLMDRCRADGLRPVSLIDEEGNIIDIECQEQEERVSVIGKAWAVFTGFTAANYGWIILVIVIIALIILYVLYRERIHSWFESEDREKVKEEKIEKPKKEPKKVQETLDSLKVSWWSRLFTRVDDEWFDKDVLNKKQYIAKRRKERLERRKKYLR